jgi:di/tricarboxylate transporter
MCPDPATRRRLVDSVAAFATALVAVGGAAAIAFGTPVGEPPSALVASAAVMSLPAASPR